MKDSTDKNNELDQYGVWVKTPAHKAADSFDESLPDFSFIDTPADTKAPEKAPLETEDASLSADEISKISGGIEEINTESTPNASGADEISLDSFITGGFTDDTPPSSSSDVSLEDFMGFSESVEEAKPDVIVDEKPMDIDLSFDDSMTVLEEEPKAQEETKIEDDIPDSDIPVSDTAVSDTSTEDVDLTSFDSPSMQGSAKASGTSTYVDLDNFDSMFSNIVDEGGLTKPVSSSDSTPVDSVNISDFGIQSDSDTAPIPSFAIDDEAKEVTDFAMDVSTDEETVTNEPISETDSVDDKDESVVLDAQPDETPASLNTAASPTTTTTSLEDDFDVDSILNSVKDEQGKTVCVGNTEDTLSEVVDSEKLDEPAAPQQQIVPETIEDLNQNQNAEEASLEIEDNPIGSEQIPDTFEEEAAFLSDSSSDKTDSEISDIPEYLPDDIASTIDMNATESESLTAEQQEMETSEKDAAATTPVELETTAQTEEPASLDSIETEAPVEEPATFDEISTQSTKEEPVPFEQSAESITAFEDSIEAPVDTSTAVEEPSSNDEMDEENRAILKQIAGELNSLKKEISGLKNEFEDLKKNTGTITPVSTLEEDKSEGFFSGTDEDETIALSGDELNNILNNADFTTAQPISTYEDEIIKEDISEAVPSADSAEEQATSETPATAAPTDDANILGSMDAAITIPEQEDDYDNEPTSLQMDFSNEKLEEPDFDSVDLNASDMEEDNSIPEEISLPKVDDVLVESSNTDLMDTQVTSSDADMLPPAQAEIIPADSLSKPIDLFKDDEPSPLTDDKLNYLSDEPVTEAVEEIPPATPETELESGAEDEAPVSAVFDQWNTPQEPEHAASEEEPADSELEPVDSTAETTALSQTDTKTDNGIPSDMKQEIKSVLTYMDQLLENLPEEKITEFAQSEQFETYKKLFVELGLA